MVYDKNVSKKPNLVEADDDLTDMSQLKNVTYEDFINYAVMSVLKSAPNDLLKYSATVDNLEALLVPQLEKENVRILKSRKGIKITTENADKYLTFEEKRVLHKKAILEEFGKGEARAELRLKQLTSFKFRELLKFIKRKTPEETTGKV